MESEGQSRRSMGVDRISNLPNSIQLKILSHLPTNDTVATCILSKDWKDVWTGVDGLVLSHSGNHNKSEQYYTTFNNFMDKIRLSTNSSCLQNLEFHICEGFDPIHVISWVDSLVKTRGVKKLILNNETGNVIRLPESWFVCPKLVELNLSTGFEISFLESQQSPNIKVIHLSHIHVESGFVNNLLLGCPNLEELVINDIQGEGNLNLNSHSIKIFECSDWSEDIAIDAPNLKSLSLLETSEVSIKAPNVTHLVLDVLAVTHMDEMPLLVHASLSINDEDDGSRVADILKKLCASRTLSVDTATIRSLGDNFGELLEFSNLTFLEVSLCNWGAVCHLLNLAPYLKHVKANFVWGNELTWVNPAADCLLLEKVHLELYQLDIFALKLIKFFFKKAASLKFMIVQVEDPPEMNTTQGCRDKELIEEILKSIPIVSTGCQIKAVQ